MSFVARFALLLLLALPNTAQAQERWADDEWAVNCAHTWLTTKLIQAPTFSLFGESCLYEIRLSRNHAVNFTITRSFRDQLSARLKDIAQFYQNEGFSAPALRKSSPGGEHYSDLISWFQPEPIQIDKYQVFLDPIPSSNFHLKNVRGFYSPSEEIIVVRIGATKIVDETRRFVRIFDSETLAHELFHALSFGANSVDKPDWIEEGLADTLAAAYMRRRNLSDPSKTLYSTMYGDKRFSEHPLMINDNNAGYDTSPFWAFLSERHFGERYTKIPALLRMDGLGDADLGAAGVDRWLRAETGQGLHDAFKEFGRAISDPDGPLWPHVDELVACEHVTFESVSDKPNQWRAEFSQHDHFTSYRIPCLKAIMTDGFSGSMEVRITALTGGPLPDHMTAYLDNDVFDGDWRPIRASEEGAVVPVVLLPEDELDFDVRQMPFPPLVIEARANPCLDVPGRFPGLKRMIRFGNLRSYTVPSRTTIRADGDLTVNEVREGVTRLLTTEEEERTCSIQLPSSVALGGAPILVNSKGPIQMITGETGPNVSNVFSGGPNGGGIEVAGIAFYPLSKPVIMAEQFDEQGFRLTVSGSYKELGSNRDAKTISYSATIESIAP